MADRAQDADYVCVCGLVIEPCDHGDDDGWHHVDAGFPADSAEWQRFWDQGCADPIPAGKVCQHGRWDIANCDPCAIDRSEVNP